MAEPSHDERHVQRCDRIAGVLLGTAVGDALGLPFEGLPRQRVSRLLGAAPLRHRFVLGRGMLSDDTEHACMTGQALLAAGLGAGVDDERFARSLAWRLRGWLLVLPAAVGWATLRALVKLWFGASPRTSGVSSAGNGAAMRAPIIGACLAHSPERIASLTRASTRLTHTDPRAEEGALLVALATAYAVRRSADPLVPAELLAELCRHASAEGLLPALHTVAEHLERGATPEQLASALGLQGGVSGFMLHTVPAALFCWLRSPRDFRRAIEDIVRMGGDTDSTAAIVGALSGAALGVRGIPAEWLEGIADWPRSVGWMRRLAERLAAAFGEQGTRAGVPLPLCWPALPARNLLFLGLALVHGLRRLLPPY